MADDEDQSSKTQDPTERKLKQLRDEGNVPHSKEVNNLFAILGMVILAGGAAPWAFHRLLDMCAAILQSAGEVDLDGQSAVGAVLSHVGLDLLIALLPLMILMLVLGYLSGWVQNGGVFSGKPLQPDLGKISPLAGFKRMFGLKSLVELLKSSVKMVVIGGAMGLVVWQRRDDVVVLMDTDLPTTLWHLQRLLLWLLGAALVVMAVMAVADFIFQRMQYIAQHRMSHRELKDEMRDSEGDPHIKQRQRQLRMERMRKRMMQAIPKADVIITNPTHYACALRYKPDEGDATPMLVAKGVDAVALRIREVAEEHGIPLYEDPPLARELFRSVEIDEAIPITLYEVVAKVMAFVMELKKKR
jgi:flagellar biosynthetic protein FlhB